jgi:hypothetical protein
MKIDALIIGSQKSATTSLLRSLAQHSSVSTHSQPEMTCFSQDWEWKQGFDYASKKYFPHVMLGDFVLAKHAHGMYSPNMIERAILHNPEVKFIILLREPTARAISAFNYARQIGAEHRTDITSAMFSHESLTGIDPNLSYIRLGEYADYLTPIFEKARYNQVHVLFLEDLKSDWSDISKNLLVFLNLPHEDIALVRENEGAGARSVKFARFWYAFNHNNNLKRLIRPLVPIRYRHKLRKSVDQMNTKESKERIVPSEDLFARLKDHYVQHNLQLESLLGRQLPVSWSTAPTVEDLTRKGQ